MGRSTLIRRTSACRSMRCTRCSMWCSSWCGWPRDVPSRDGRDCRRGGGGGGGADPRELRRRRTRSDRFRRGAPAGEAGPVSFRRGSVSAVDEAGPVARIRVNCGDQERAAIAYSAVEVGDDVVVNTDAVDLGLSSGGFDIVHVNLTRGLDQPGPEDAHVMKLNYTSLQHAVNPVEIDVDREIGGERGS